MNNANLPPIRVRVSGPAMGTTCDEYGHLMSVRSMLNQALQFSVLLDSGALYTGLPANAIKHFIKRKQVISEPLALEECQAYDCIGNDIEVFTIQHMLYMNCSVKSFIGDKIWEGVYLFTIDFVDPNGLARHPEQWKTFMCIALNNGHLVFYPQYRIRFLDGAFCPDHIKPLPKYGYNTNVHLAE